MSNSKPQKMSVTGANFLGNLVSSTPSTIDKEQICDIEISKIYRPTQQRVYFDREDIEKLKTAIEEEGFRGAVLVTILPDKHIARDDGYEYELVYGASRTLACEELGNKTIRAEIKKLTPQQIRRIRFDENMVRKNLNPFEELSGYLELMADEVGADEEFVEQELNYMSNSSKRGSDLSEEVANNLEIYQMVLDRYGGGKLSTYRTKLIKFRSLPLDIKEALEEGQIDASKAIELGSIKNDDDRLDLLSWVIQDNPSVADIRSEKRGLLQALSSQIKHEKTTPNVRKANEAMTRLSGLMASDAFNKRNKRVGEVLGQINKLLLELDHLN